MNRRLSVFLISTALLTLILLGKALFLAVQAQSTLLWAESYPVQLRVSKLDKSNIAIRRNDVNAGLPTVQLSSATYTVNENAGAVVVTFLLSHASTQHVTVDFATNRGTANDGEDYERTSGTIGFGPGMTSTTLDTLIINDIISEGNETFNLVLTSPSGATLGVPNTAVITIIDNDQPAAFSCNNVTEIPKTECDALVALSNSTSGPNWLDHTDWLATNTPCSWYGITCNAGHVTEVFLYNNQLNGSIPLDLSNLQALQKLNLSFNGLNGSIPPQLGNLSNLLELTLAFNQLSGSIPLELSNISSLKYLDLTSNQLSGTIPPTLGSLNRLSTLLLSKNQLSGSAPSELGNLVNLQYLYLDNNLFDGTLPSNLVNLTSLVHFWFQNTGLCEPVDIAFQTWLVNIGDLNRTGVLCTALPSAEFDAWPQSGNTPLTVAMHIVSTTNISNCAWEYGDGQTGNSCAAYHDHTYTAAGTYTVKLTMSSPGGSDTKTRNNYITVFGQQPSTSTPTSTSTNTSIPTSTAIGTATPVPPINTLKSVIAGQSHTCLLTNSSGVKCWGANSSSQLGDGTTTNRSTPVDVVGLSGATALALGGNHTCALTNSGSVKCWGANSNGQLGDGTITNHNTPVDISGLSNGAIAIAAGFSHTCLLTNSGGVKCWGANYNGQLGDGTTTNRNIPVDVVGLSSGVIAITLGGYHTCALKSTGGVKCWGINNIGQLGDGTTTNRSTPVEVSNLSSGGIDVEAGYSHTCGLTNSGGVKCWGANSNGQLGDGTITNRNTPIDVVGLNSEMKAISAGTSHTCGLTRGGGVKCWGYNYDGEIGDGTTTNRNTPVEVSNLTSRVTAIAAGSAHTCSLTDSGGVKCWGNNVVGQLGNGTTTNSLVPVDVQGLGEGVSTPTSTPTNTPVPPSAYSISGKVTDGHYHPLVDVFVGLVDLTNKAFVITHTTDINGYYTLNGANPGKTYTVRVVLRDKNNRRQIRWGNNGGLVDAQTIPFQFDVSQTSIIKNIDFGDTSLDSILVPIDQLDDVAAMYHHTTEVQDFVVEKLGLLEYQPVLAIYGFSGAGSGASYFSDRHSILIKDDSSRWESISNNYNRPMNREWHENFHHLMNVTIGLPPIRNGENHQGLNNPTTNDSWSEGWAEFWPSILWDSLGYPGPELYRWSASPISIEVNWQVWHKEAFQSLEEFAVASLLWDFYDPKNSIDSDNIDINLRTIWSVIGRTTPNNSLTDIRDVYDAFRQANLVNEDGSSVTGNDIDQIFVAHGFYADLNNNHNRESGEEVGWGGLSNRRSTPEVPNAYLKINTLNQNSEPIQNSSLLVEVHFDNSYYDYSYTTELDNATNLVYFAPPPAPFLATAQLTIIYDGGRSDPYMIESSTYWDAVLNSTTGYAEEHTFVLNYLIYLPVVTTSS